MTQTNSQSSLSPQIVELVVLMVRSALAAEENPHWMERVHQLPEDQVTGLLTTLTVHRIAEVIVSSPYFDKLPEPIAHHVERRTRSATGKALLLGNTTRDVFEVLNNGGVSCVIYKGIPLSLLSTGRINARGPGDVDVLIKPEDALQAHQLLIQAGWHSDFGTIPGHGMAWKFYSWLSRELPYSRNDSHVDLHWRLSEEVKLFPRTQILIGRAQSLQLGKTKLHTLSSEDALAAACYHFYHDGCHSLRALIDVYRLSHQMDEQNTLDYSPALSQLVQEVVSFADLMLSPGVRSYLGERQSPPGRIAKLWLKNSGTIELADDRKTVPLNKLHAALILQLNMGNVSSNLFHYLTARLFEFNNLDLRRGPLVLVVACVAEIQFQWRHRVLRHLRRLSGRSEY